MEMDSGKDNADDDETKGILDKEAKDKKGRGIFNASANAINVLLGAGIVSLPWSFSVTGFGMSFVVLCVTAIASGYTFSLLVTLADITGTVTYQDTAKVAFGRTGYVLLGIILVLNDLINVSAYTIFIVDNTSKLLIRAFDLEGIDELTSHFWGSRAFLCAVPLLLFVTPLSSLKDIGYFGKWATFSIASIAFTVVLFFTRLATLKIPKTPNAYRFTGTSMLEGFGTLIYSYQVHDATHAIYDTLANKSQRRWNMVVIVSHAFSTIPLLIIGSVGFVIFTGNSQGNIFENFCIDDDLVNAGRFMFVIHVLLNCPSCIYVIRQVAVRTFLQKSKLNETLRNILISVITSTVAYCISLSTECLSIVLEITGIVTSIPMMFIVPALLALRIKPDRLLSIVNIPNILVLLFGAILVVAGAINIITHISHGQVGCYEGHEPGYCFGNNTLHVNDTSEVFEKWYYRHQH